MSGGEEKGKIPKIRIGSRIVGEGEPCFVIAEIGINHNGSLETAFRLIDAAREAGADAVKFQKRTLEVVYTPDELSRPRESPFGTTNGDLKRALEFGMDQYREIDRHCREKGILWFASCWDEASVDFIEAFRPPCYKIASAALTDAELLRHTASKGRPMIVSTGMSTLEEIRAAVRILERHLPGQFVLMHSNSTYPSENAELNLRVISALSREFGVPVGYSGHEKGVSPSVMAAVLGACVIERHITLDRTMWGTDQAASLEPKGFDLLVRDLRVWEQARGDGRKRVYDTEIPVMKKLRRKRTLPLE